VIAGEGPAASLAGMYYHMQRFQQTRRVRPMGPHRQLSDQVLGALRERCRACEGSGALALANASMRDCPHCEGVGGVWACSEETLATAYRLLEAVHPGCTIPGITPPKLRFPERRYRHKESP
jgi:hypothetical protein